MVNDYRALSYMTRLNPRRNLLRRQNMQLWKIIITFLSCFIHEIIWNKKCTISSQEFMACPQLFARLRKKRGQEQKHISKSSHLRGMMILIIGKNYNPFKPGNVRVGFHRIWGRRRWLISAARGGGYGGKQTDKERESKSRDSEQCLISVWNLGTSFFSLLLFYNFFKYHSAIWMIDVFCLE